MHSYSLGQASYHVSPQAEMTVHLKGCICIRFRTLPIIEFGALRKVFLIPPYHNHNHSSQLGNQYTILCCVRMKSTTQEEKVQHVNGYGDLA